MQHDEPRRILNKIYTEETDLYNKALKFSDETIETCEKYSANNQILVHLAAHSAVATANMHYQLAKHAEIELAKLGKEPT